MATIAELAVKIGADISEFQKKMQKVGRQLEGIDQKMEGIGQKMSLAISLPLMGIGAASLKAASDLEETESKFQAVFRHLSEDVKEWADIHAKAVGRGTGDLMDYLATMQDTFVPLGFARDEAAQMAQQITKLSIDLASFNNIADSEALASLQSAMVGNHETVRKFGVIITETTLKQELLNMGFKGGYENATNQQKALARLNIIMKGTTDAQGDAVKTAGGFANQMKALKADVVSAGEAIGKILIPAAQKLIGVARGWLEKFQALDDVKKRMIVNIGLLAAGLGPLILGLGKLVTTLVRVATAMTAANLQIVAIVGSVAILGAAAKIIIDAWTNASDVWGWVWTNFELAVAKFSNKFYEMLGGVLEFFGVETPQIFKDFEKHVDSLEQKAQTFEFGKNLVKEFDNVKKSVASFINGDWLKSGGSGGNGAEEMVNKMIEPIKKLPSKIAPITMQVAEGLKKGMEPVYNSLKEAEVNITQFLGSIAGQFADSLGGIAEGLASGEMSMGDAFNSMMMTLLDFVSQFGQTLIAAGFAALAAKKLFANPAVAIAAGTALVALAGALKGMMSQDPTAGASSGYSYDTTGRGAEYSDTRRYAGGSTAQNVTFRMEGTEMVGTFDRVTTYSNRRG